MGTWGYKLFEDDSALDIRAEFRDHIGDGLTPEQATKKVVRSWRPSRRIDEADYAQFWLALATTQWDLGRLTPEAKTRALEVLEKGLGLELWAEAGSRALEKRKAAYKAIRKKLLSPPPAPRHIPKRSRSTTDWRPGHLLSYRTTSGRTIYLRVIACPEDRGGRYATVEVLTWNRPTRPTRRQAEIARRMCARGDFRDGRGSAVTVLGSNCRGFPADRLEVIETALKLRGRMRGELPGVFPGKWARFDGYLKDAFGID